MTGPGPVARLVQAILFALGETKFYTFYTLLWEPPPPRNPGCENPKPNQTI